MKKATILLVTMLFVFMGAITEAQQGKKIDQKKLSADDQIEYLNDSIKTYDGIIKNMDEIIGIYQKQKTSIIEERAKLGIYKEMLVSSRKEQLKERGVVSVTIVGSNAIIEKLDREIDKVERKNAVIEDTLKKQREWKASHPGRTN